MKPDEALRYEADRLLATGLREILIDYGEAASDTLCENVIFTHFFLTYVQYSAIKFYVSHKLVGFLCKH
jgi:hypothetical protein